MKIGSNSEQTRANAASCRVRSPKGDRKVLIGIQWLMFAVLLLAGMGTVLAQTPPPVPQAIPSIRIVEMNGGITVTLTALKTNNFVSVFAVINGKPVSGFSTDDRVNLVVSGSPDPDVTVAPTDAASPSADTTLFVGYYGIKFGKEHVGKTHTYAVTASNPAGVATNAFFIKVAWSGPLELAPPPGAPAPTLTNSAGSTGVAKAVFKRLGINLRERGDVSVVDAIFVRRGLNLHTGDARVTGRADMSGGSVGGDDGRGDLAIRKDIPPIPIVRISLRPTPSAQRIGLRLRQPVVGIPANIPPDPNAPLSAN